MIKFVISPQYQDLEDFVMNLPNTFMENGEIVYAERNLIKTFDVGKYKINIKSFKKPILINQFVYATFRASKAKRSYLYAHKLKEKGFNTPDPIGYMEQKAFVLLKYSLYISIHEEFDGLMRELHKGKIEGREQLILQFARYTAQLHENKILHIDYSPGNILYKKVGENYSFYLVDLNRMTFDKEIDMEKACFNFRRLWGNDEMIEMFAREYAKARNFDEEECVQKTLDYRTKFWKNLNKQHPGATPYIGE